MRNRIYHYCAMHCPQPGHTAYIDGTYQLEGDTLNLDAVRGAAAEAMRAKKIDSATSETVLLMSLTRLD
jgi:hypothetical protein